MPNTVEWKEYLFVKLPTYAKNPWVINNGKESVGLNWYDESRTFGEEGNTWSEGIKLPPGSWQIIGKGDAIDWEGIVSKAEITDPRGHQVTAMDSAISILLTYGMRPSTTLVLKKQTKLK